MKPTAKNPTRILAEGGRAIAQSIGMYRLTVRGPDGQETTREVAQPVLRVGAQTGNDMILADDSVSRIHFEIVIEPKGFRLKDLGSTNGTLVEGLRVLDLYLKSGARIRAGRTHLLFETLDREATVALAQEDSFGPLVGKSAPMRALFAVLKRVSIGNATVLIEGESGTGKELIAEAIHSASGRAEGPFAVFDCAAIPANLMESELFGHERGAFTSAQGTRIGRFEEAHGGTLFLDEIGELPLELQPKLLRAIESREVRRLGGDRSRKVDVRIVAATNRDLANEVNQGTFRHDLYYRLAVVRVAVPPLRERVEDIPVLVEHFLRAAAGGQTDVSTMLAAIKPESWSRLETHAWRGNVRELRNAIERTLALSGDAPPEGIELALGPALTGFPQRAAGAAPAAATSTSGVLLPFQDKKREVLAELERVYFRELYARCNGNISEMSRRAGMERAHVRSYLRRHGIGNEPIGE